MKIKYSISLLFYFFIQVVFQYPLYPQIRFLEQNRASGMNTNFDDLFFSTSRKYIDLSGEWRYSENQIDWYNINIPSMYEGIHKIIVKRKFVIPAQIISNSSCQFNSLGINYYSEISINGSFVGKHVGSSPFYFNLNDDLIKPGENEIEITVDNTLNVNETIPLSEKLFDPKNYGGLFRNIFLSITSPVWTHDVNIQFSKVEPGKPFLVNCSAILETGNLTKLRSDSVQEKSVLNNRVVEYYFEIYDKSSGNLVVRSDIKSVKIETDRSVRIEGNASISDLKLWSIEIPNLYSIRQIIAYKGNIIDNYSQNIGFKHVEIKNNHLFLNGDKFFIKGITYSEYSPNHGSSLDEDEIERDLIMIKNLGANTIRLISGSINPYLISLCAKYGLLVCVDIPLNRTPSSILKSNSILSTSKNYIQDILTFYRNQVSILAFGLASGIDCLSSGYEEYLDKISSMIKLQSPHLLYATFSSLEKIQIPEGIDIVGLDIPTTDLSLAKSIITNSKEISKSLGKPVMISSLEHGVQISNYNGYSDPRSIDAQALFYLDIYPIINELGYSGVFLHSFNDSQTGRPIMNQDIYYQYLITNGLVDQYRQKRLSYDVVKALFNNEKVPTLVIGKYSEQFPPIFIIVGIFLIFVFAIVYNVFRRFRENVVRALLRPFNFFTDVSEQRMLSTFQTTIIGIIGSISAGLFTANLLYFWKTNYWFDYFLSLIVTSNGLKEVFNLSAWYPFIGILIISSLYFIVLFFYSIFLWMISLATKKKTSLFDSYSIAMWSILPMLILAPFGMILNRIMTLSIVEYLALSSFILFNVWVFSRLLKGTSIALNIRSTLLYTIGYSAVICIICFWIISLNQTHALFDYLKYGWDIAAFLRSTP